MEERNSQEINGKGRGRERDGKGKRRGNERNKTEGNGRIFKCMHK